ncbi:helix-turn-helix transcriptional regulator [Staphylococcus equorum]|uniref:helix-turn-helix domain-containing protein n=1 Tax=Staphylococcus equorum TaxID=246432 RepID=UPI002553DEBD|nr:helix-turn-helix transcriptional regulator [Staphylococcus equorum]MDK9847686.1 helix-turn-helix transcriptional regulator [Staphylococcus equorum]
MNEYRIQKLYKYICLEFKNQRQLIGKRQEEVAFDLSVTAGHLSRIENGKKPKIALHTFLVMSEYYDVDFGKIVNNAKEKMNLDEGI